MRDARYGLRGIRVGEASNPGPTRRIRDPSEAVIDSLERELTMVDSDEEPLVRPSVGRNVIPRLFPAVPSEQCATVVEASHPGPLHTPLNSMEWRVTPTGSTVPASLPTLRRAEEPGSTVPASSRALIAAGQAEPDNRCADREDDDCSSASSEGETGDIGDDEVPEWGTLPPEFVPVGTRRPLRTGTLLDSSVFGLVCTEKGGSGVGDDVSETIVSVAVQPRLSHVAPPNDHTGVAPGEAVPFCGSGWNVHRRLKLVGIEAPSLEVSSLLSPTVPVPSRAVSQRSNGARNVVPRVAGVESVADSTLVDPEPCERAVESAVYAARSVSEDVHGALEFHLWTPRDSEEGAVLQGDPRRMSQCPTVAAESGEIGMAHVSPRVSTSVVSCRGVAQRASMVHAPVSSNRFAALVDDEVEVHHDSGSETVSMGDVEQVREVVEDWGSAASEAGSHFAEEDSTPDVFDADEARMTGPTIRAAFQSLDHVDLERMFQRRACVMRSVPRILNGPFRVALRIAVQEILDGVTTRDVARQVRGWKVLFLLPRMLLCRPPRGGKVSKEKLTERLENFRNGRWIDLVRDSEEIGDQAATARRRQRRRGDDVESRAARAMFLT